MTKYRSLLSYGDFQGSADISVEDDCLFGRILHIDDVVTYEANSPQELEKSFKAAVDDYLDFCKEQGHNPCKPYKGGFNVRVSPDLHKKLAYMAKKKDMSLNEIVNEALAEKVDAESRVAGPVIHHHNHFVTVNNHGSYDSEEGAAWSEKAQKPKLSMLQ
ncbi:MAG: type II toxin-antitoxin system HicB family antitoxin [Nitrosospira sp.]|nr:type II toxin-antitoxin system HicB family antitoxin [Nitrosospira sp.]